MEESILGAGGHRCVRQRFRRKAASNNFRKVSIDAFRNAVSLSCISFDLDYPLEVDEEFWPGEPLSDPENPWAQPSQKPANVVTWILCIKLLDILSFAQVTIVRRFSPLKLSRLI